MWGLGYKIATQKLRKHRVLLPPKKIHEQISLLFPAQNTVERQIDRPNAKPTSITSAELAEAIGKMKNKAPGPDEITAQLLRAAVEANPQLFLQEINSLWEDMMFPTNWKNARSVLIEKPRKTQDTETTYRSICLLNELAKLYERIVKAGLDTELEKHGGPQRAIWF